MTIHDDIIKLQHFPMLLALCEGNPPVTGGFPSHRSVTRRFDVFFDLHHNKRLSNCKQSRRWWFVACSAPSHYLNHCCIIVNWTQRNKVQSNCIWNSNIFIQENASENVVWEIAAILSQSQCVNEKIRGPVSKKSLPSWGLFYYWL